MVTATIRRADHVEKIRRGLIDGETFGTIAAELHTSKTIVAGIVARHGLTGAVPKRSGRATACSIIAGRIVTAKTLDDRRPPDIFTA